MHRRAFLLNTGKALAAHKLSVPPIKAATVRKNQPSDALTAIAPSVRSTAMHLLDLATTPFSRRGCWLNLAIKQQPLGIGLYLRSNHASTVNQPREHFLISLWRDNQPVPATITARHSVIAATPVDGSAGCVEFVLDGEGTLRARGTGIGLRLESTISQGYLAAAEVAPSHFMVNQRDTYRRYSCSSLRGELRFQATWDGTNARDVALTTIGETYEIAKIGRASCRER